MASWKVKSRGLRAGLTVAFILGAAAAPVAAPPPVVEPIGNDGGPGPITLAPPPNPVQAAEPVRAGNPLWAIPVRDLAATRERPIFSPSRRPPPPVVAATPYVPPPPAVKPVEPERPQLELVGTVVNAREGFGIFVDQATNTVVRLRTGESHKGWILRSVQGREVTLETDRETAVLALPAHGAEQPGTPPAGIAPLPSVAEPMRTPPPKLHHQPDD